MTPLLARVSAALTSALFIAISFAQTGTSPSSFVGTVLTVHAETREIEIKRDQADNITIKLDADCKLLLVKPNETSLKNAQPVDLASLGERDRVLISVYPVTQRALRIVIMGATDIARRDDQERADWVNNGVFGVVAAKRDNKIVLTSRGFTGEARTNVLIDGNTSFRKYGPNSVSFGDALPSSFAEIQINDQLRARGGKDENGALKARDVVFGTFVINIGTITGVSVDTKQVNITSLATHKPMLVKLRPDSQLKVMPQFTGAIAARLNAGGKVNASGSRFPGPPGAGSSNGSAPDLAQTIEWLPGTRLQDLKIGDTVVISSSKGSDPNQITAILFLDNADTLLQMAAFQRIQADSPGGPAFMPKGNPSTLLNALNGMELPAMTP
jgi:hypothetical protein